MNCMSASFLVNDSHKADPKSVIAKWTLNWYWSFCLLFPSVVITILSPLTRSVQQTLIYAYYMQILTVSWIFELVAAAEGTQT